MASGGAGVSWPPAVETAPIAPDPAPFVPAGAYLPPSAVFAPDASAAAAASGSARTPTLRAGSAPLLADLPLDAPDDLAGWVVVAGGGLAAVGFFLPWSTTVIGSTAAGSYLDSWGFASAMHLPVFGLTLLALALALVPSRLPRWIGAGALPLVLGGLVLGLLWPYAMGPLGAQLGAWAEIGGAALLVIGGMLSIHAARGTDRREPAA